MSQPPTGTVTFLFTDIDGSTERWERQREAIQAALPSKATSPRYSGPFSTHAATSSSKATDGLAAALAYLEVLWTPITEPPRRVSGVNQLAKPTGEPAA